MVIPAQPVPSQSISVVLAGQPCRINVYAKSTGLYADLYRNDDLVIGGVLCRNATLLVREPYRGFIGDVAFFDTQGDADPVYGGLGSRWWLCYIEAWQFVG